MKLGDFKREVKKARRALSESLKRCQELLWDAERDGLYGQAHMDAEEAVRIVERLKCAMGILSSR